MILEFSVTNFRSIKEKQTLSLLKTKKNELENNFTTLTLSTGKTLDVLNSAVIYGANASGKSNLLLAMKKMVDVILGVNKSIEPFLLSENSKNQPSEFEIDFVDNGVRFVYGFSIMQEKIIDEWLYQYPKGRPQALIERENTNTWGAMTALKGNKGIWKESTKDTVLFLSTAVQLNCHQLFEINTYIQTLWLALGDVNQYIVCDQFMFQANNFKERTIQFLQQADDEIIDFNIEKKMDGSARDFNITIYRQSENGKKIGFDLSKESSGTKKIFFSTGYWIDTLIAGSVLILDELQNSLHPKLVEYLVQMFHDPALNKKGAQLIFVTHETSLLDQDIFRRDQVWFCEKNNNATELFSLADFSVRKGAENIEKFYLSGRYGAVPYLK